MADFFDPLMNTGGMTASKTVSKAEVISTGTESSEPTPKKKIVKTKNLFGDDSDEDEPAPKPVLKVKPLSDAIKTPQKKPTQKKPEKKEEEEPDIFTEDNTAKPVDEVTSLTEELAGSSLFEDRPDPEATFGTSKSAAIHKERMMASVKVKGEEEETKTAEELRKEEQQRKEEEELLNIGDNNDLDSLTKGILDEDDVGDLLGLAGDGAAGEATEMTVSILMRTSLKIARMMEVAFLRNSARKTFTFSFARGLVLDQRSICIYLWQAMFELVYSPLNA